MYLSNVYQNIITKGIKEDDENGLIKKVKLLNTYVVVWGILIVVFSLIDLLTFYNFYEKKFHLEEYRFIGMFGQLTTLFGFGLVYLLNINYLFKWGRALFIFTAMVNFSIFAYWINPGRYLEYFFILLPSLGLTLFQKNTFPFILVLVSFGLYVTTYYGFDIYPIDYTRRILSTTMFCIFLSIYLLTNYFKKQNHFNEDLLGLENDKVLSDKMILEIQEAELRELHEFKSHFFVNLSHEIRTPLTLIQGYAAQINLEEAKQETEQKIAVITEQAYQMQSIINNIMDLSKMDSKAFELCTKSYNIQDLLSYNYNNFKPLFDKKEILFILENDHNNIEIEVDKELFDKIFNNLLSNALKFTTTNGKVVLKTILTVDNLCIEVIDNGIGIPKEEKNKVFKRFYQVQNDITKSQGSGIGLAFTKSIVEAHGFEINLESEPNVMTKISIQIPKTSIKSSLENTRIKTELNVLVEEAVVVDKAVNYSKKKRVLIVDDHEQMRLYLRKVLNHYDITEAENGKQALEVLENNKFDLILTDFMMPVMDGEALVLELKKQNIKTSIIVLTARMDQSAKLNMLRLGIDCYLQKPFLEEELLLQVKNAIRLYHNIKEFTEVISVEERLEYDKTAQQFHTKITDYITTNLTSPLLSVDSIAAYLNMSRSTLKRKTNAILGQTVNDLILEARLSQVRILRIEDPYLNKKEIAAKVGASNTTYLFKKLEERYGKV